MSPAMIVREARAEGVELALSPAGTIKATGYSQAVSRWLAVIREHKADIVEVLRGDTDSMASQQQSALIGADEISAVRAWLTQIDEADPAIIAAAIYQCQHDADARDYFVRRATTELPRPYSISDDRRTCYQCANLSGQHCKAARRGEIVASRRYEPVRDLPRRCEAYVPRHDDAGRKSGLRTNSLRTD